ncbi:hypothetical protein QZH41_010827, partial [Actinostola sp. cb2023]
IIFEGTIGHGVLSDIALDDIILKDCTGGQGRTLYDVIVPAIGTLYDVIVPAIGTLYDVIVPAIGTLYDVIVPAIGTLYDVIVPAIGTLYDIARLRSDIVRPSTRIVGGVDAMHGGWPWQAMLRYATSGSQFCGGALVHPEWVVTASHCVDRLSAAQVHIRMGAHKRTSTVGTEQDFKVSKIIKHSSYQSHKSYSHDIALLKLDRPALLDKYTNIVCLPESIPDVSAGSGCWITGCGTLSSGGSQPETLQQASVPIVHQDTCMKSYPNEIDDTMICAGLQQGGIDACQGDSGGPMVCETAGRFYLHGATSWGYGCAYPDKYGVYARVNLPECFMIMRVQASHSIPL